MKRIFWGACGVPLLIGMAAVCGPEAAPEAVRIVTVESLQDVLAAWKETSGLNLQTEVSDFKSALRTLAGEKADFALVTGTLTPGDKAMLSSQPGTMALTVRAGWEVLSLLVHPSNPIPSISLTAARTLFAASSCVTSASPLLTWSDLPGSPGTIWSASIEVFMPHPGSYEEEALKGLLLGDCQPRTDCQILTTEAMIERSVASHPGAIGVVSRLRYIPGARILPVTGEMESPPGRESLLTPKTSGKGTRKDSRSNAAFKKTHPLAREITLVSRRRYSKGTPQAAFSLYALSAAGQAEMKRLGFFPLGKD